LIQLRISSYSTTQIVEIAELLLKDHLAIDVNITRDVERLTLEGNELKRETKTLLTAKTKALLFPHIDRLLRELYPQNLPEIYSLAIVQMDWDQANKLRKDVIKT
jgi:uncharacterized protein involved in tolerance to divalent cations